ncbi:MAG: hypothetical protein WCO12_03465 [bacterium]
MNTSSNLFSVHVAGTSVSGGRGGLAYEHSSGDEYEAGHRRPPTESSVVIEGNVSPERPPLVPITSPDPQMSLRF